MFFINPIRKPDTDTCICLEFIEVLLIKPEVTNSTGKHRKQQQNVGGKKSLDKKSIPRVESELFYL